MLIISLGVLFPSCLVDAAELPALRVSENRRFLETVDGNPFFYMGDTAWELFHRLNREEAERYLKNRSEKGFTVIQAVVLAELGGLETPNAYGEIPFIDRDPKRVNEKYFQHVDFILNQAEALGLYIGMLPTWGSYWKTKAGGEYNLFTPENAHVYGKYLGERYRQKPIIWILGGDQNIENDKEREIVEAMASGIREGDQGRHLMTYHPRGPGMSSDYFHQAAWLDFNMIQSSHAARDHDTGIFVEHDYSLQPVKPTLDGEPRYETIPVGFYNRDASRFDRFDDDDVRQAAYWALFSGACGHTYGNNNIWQMWDHGRNPVIHASIPWHASLDHPGAFQMGHLRRLFESRPFTMLVPDQSLIKDGPVTGGAKIRSLRATDGSFAFIYSPHGESFTVRMDVIQSKRVAASWFDPRYGIADAIHTGSNAAYQSFVPPTSGRGNDWVLVLDDADRGYSQPGVVSK